MAIQMLEDSIYPGHTSSDNSGPMEEPQVAREGEAVQEDEDERVLVLLCVLHPVGGRVPATPKIWRRIAVPANFSLLELHVALQNAFDWDNMHLHNFQQPKSSPAFRVPSYSGFGKTDVASIPILDLDRLSESQVRTFQSVIGIEDTMDMNLLTPAEGRPAQEVTVYVQHSHPHQEHVAMLGDNSADFYSSPKEVLEERAFLVKNVFKPAQPALVYEYDYGMSHQVTILFQGVYSATEGVNYPTCLAGAGASRAEDGNDMDGDGNLLPSYDYEDFAVIEVVRNFEHTYEDSWPVGPRAEDNITVPRCYMCRYNQECARRTKCTGACCDYCLKSPIALNAGRLSLNESDSLCEAATSKVVESRQKWIQDGSCNWVEEDGQPCMYCSEVVD